MKTSSGTGVTQMLSSVTGPCMYGHETVEELGHVIVVELLAVRLERGNGSGASDSVLEALQLDDAECAHLFDLARAASPIATRRRRRPFQQCIRPAVQRILVSIGAPATVSNLRGPLGSRRSVRHWKPAPQVQHGRGDPREH